MPDPHFHVREEEKERETNKDWRKPQRDGCQTRKTE